MKKQMLNANKEKKLSLPKWLKSYHLLLFALIVVLIFGAVMKHGSEI